MIEPSDVSEEENAMKKILTIQDISCVGKCSLTTALPVISAMGIETCVIPTAVLSNHTAFSSFTFRDLTEDIPGIYEVWKKEGFRFGAVYSGYLGSAEQIGLVRRAWQEFGGKDALKIVDPAMADHGKLYTGFSESFVSEMASLCGQADLILPNLTEGCLMTGHPYREGGGEAYYKDLLRKLGDLGAGTVVMTGVGLQEGRLGAMTYRRSDGSFSFYDNEKLPVSFHGTGDIFASCVTGALALGCSAEEAAALAVDFTLECMKETMKDPDHSWYGVNFESALPWLTDRVRDLG
jgi:pyridoxine kinase